MVMLKIRSNFKGLLYLSLLGVLGCLSDFPEYIPYNESEVDAAVDATMTVVSQELPCNGVDEDQDGIIDEFVEFNCQDGLGICEGSGSWVCVFDESGLSQKCVIPNQIQPQATEVCDNSLDEDCDGSLDEGCRCEDGSVDPCYSGDSGSRGLGECRDGVQRCTGGVFGECEGARLPAQELCNGLDDNCNGETDEGEMECETVCGTGRGICQQIGSGEYDVINCSAPRRQDEVCDNADNDCDGVVDEDVPLENAACPITSGCRGQQKCIDGLLVCDNTQPVNCLCETLPLADGRHHLCRSPALDAGRASVFCGEHDLGALVLLNSFAEYMSVFHGLKTMGIAEEVWVDGNRLDETATLTDQTILDPLLFTEGDLSLPNQRNRIVLNTSTGLLNTRSSNATRAFVCELPCTRSDSDQDLVTQCDGDCDDANRNVKPSAAEAVGDGIDNNCNGAIDEIGPEVCGDEVDNDGNGSVDEVGCMANCVPFWRDDTMTLVCRDGKNWRSAVNHCAEFGLQLAEIRTFEDWRLLWVWFDVSSVTPSRANYWIGLRRSGDAFRYEATQDSVALDSEQWGPGQPDNHFNGEDCAELWCDNSNECSGTWNDQNCTNFRWFLCETVP
jgi:hypothetical protein